MSNLHDYAPCQSDELNVSFPATFLHEMGLADSVDDMLNTVSKWVGKIIPSSRCSIALLEEDDRPMEERQARVFALTGSKAIAQETCLPVQGSNLGRAILTRLPNYVPDLRHCTAIEAPLLRDAGLNSCVACPLISGQYCFGTLNIAHIKTNHYNQLDIERQLAIASWIASHLRMAKQVEQLVLLSRTDHLTGALNRHGFSEISTTMFNQWQRSRIPFALVLLDIDHFKSINDQCGHKAGDDVLLEAVGRIARRIRSSDIFARIGGEEFAVLLPDTNIVGATRAAEIYRGLIANVPFYSDKRRFDVTISGGVACPTTDDTDFEQLMLRADQLLYHAKENGRNRIEYDARLRMVSPFSVSAIET